MPRPCRRTCTPRCGSIGPCVQGLERLGEGPLVEAETLGDLDRAQERGVRDFCKDEPRDEERCRDERGQDAQPHAEIVADRGGAFRSSEMAPASRSSDSTHRCQLGSTRLAGRADVERSSPGWRFRREEAEPTEVERSLLTTRITALELSRGGAGRPALSARAGAVSARRPREGLDFSRDLEPLSDARRETSG